MQGNILISVAEMELEAKYNLPFHKKKKDNYTLQLIFKSFSPTMKMLFNSQIKND